MTKKPAPQAERKGTGRIRRVPARKSEVIDTFFDWLAKGWSVGRACEESGLGYTTVFEWKKTNPVFLARWEAAMERGADIFEDAARKRAIEGTEKPVFQGGDLVGHVQEYSDMLMALLLKGKRPKYRDRQPEDEKDKTAVVVVVRGGLPDPTP